MELVAIASSHQRLTTNQRVMSRFDAVKEAAVSPLENCRRLPQSAPHTYPEPPHGEAEQTRRKEAKQPTCWGCRTANESKDFAPGRGSYAEPPNTAICVGAAPRGEWRPFHDIWSIPQKWRTARSRKSKGFAPRAGLLQCGCATRSAQCRRLRHISCASLALSGRSITPFSVTM